MYITWNLHWRIQHHSTLNILSTAQWTNIMFSKPCHDTIQMKSMRTSSILRKTDLFTNTIRIPAYRTWFLTINTSYEVISIRHRSWIIIDAGARWTWGCCGFVLIVHLLLLLLVVFLGCTIFHMLLFAFVWGMIVNHGMFLHRLNFLVKKRKSIRTQDEPHSYTIKFGAVSNIEKQTTSSYLDNQMLHQTLCFHLFRIRIPPSIAQWLSLRHDTGQRWSCRSKTLFQYAWAW